MPQIKLPALVAAISLLSHVIAQQSCINTCTDSANVLTQLKSCSGCGTDDWACFCRCQQYMNALVSCTQQNCDGSDIENSIVSFCANQGVSISYNSAGSVSIDSTTTSGSSTTSASATSSTTFSTTTTGTMSNGFLSSAVAGSTASSTTGSSTSSSSFTATDSSDISSYLATAIPAGARTESSDACFVNTHYSYYSTPTWFSTLPTQAQSYYSSVNQGNTAACTLNPSQAAALAAATGSGGGGHHGLSGGAIAGIVIGSIIAALLLLLLLLCCLRRRRRTHRERDADRARHYQPRNSGPGAYNGNEKGLGGGAVPGSHGRGPYRNGDGLAAGAVGPGHNRHPSHNHNHGHGNGLAAAAPVANGRGAHGAPYGNGGSNGFGAAGAPMHHGAGGGLNSPAGVPGGAASGPGGSTPDYSHTTTTTVRHKIPLRRKF